MSEVTSYEQGQPCWLDLGTTDTAAAREFYGRLFGWDYDVGGPESGNYIQALRGGKRVAGMYELMPEMREQGVPPNWTTYVSVEDVDEFAKRVSDAGGRVVMGPMDVLSEGRLAVAQDPTGATFGAWQPGNHRGSQLLDEHGSLTWVELLTRQPEQATEFYRIVLGCTTEDMDTGGAGTYRLLKIADRAVAGLMAMPEQVPAEVPAHWLPYFAVEDADAAVSAVSAGGGQVLYGPVDMPTVGRFATLQDPQGAVFAIIKNAERA